jgi:hypothetical protein
MQTRAVSVEVHGAAPTLQATIPAIANIGVATAYADWAELGGAATQLGLNLIALVLGGLARLTVQRRMYEVRLKRHSTGSMTEP